MPERQWDNRIKDLFNDALDLDERERSSFLDEVAPDDPKIRTEVRLLLEAHERAGDFLADPGADGVERPGEFIGRYKLLELLGEGGFARVYLAEQREPVARHVALKIIKLGMDTRQVIGRFEAERQALALMEHPHMAAVHDAGATSTGRPYFVMELVRGLPITDYCDHHRLSVAQRLHLFCQVCEAVQHAHTKGVIHRDIKPTNVLVRSHDGQAIPKVIDFGIAKAISGRLTEQTLFTEGRQLLGTFEYMSPEQAEASPDIDTRSDVYSLGVLLFELLTGTTPLGGRGKGVVALGEIQRILREQEPPKPSARCSVLSALGQDAAQRAVEPRRLISQLRGELDWITLKALDKDRERRYASPGELADDIRRYVAGEPVRAGPPGAAYRMKTFLRRHRTGAVAAALIALAVIGGTVGTTLAMLAAQESADEAQKVNEFMRDVLTSVQPDAQGPDVRLAEVLDDASRTASQRFAGHPVQEALVREMLGQVYFKLSMFTKSARERGQAVTLWKSAAGEDDPRTLAAELDYVNALLGAERAQLADETLRRVAPIVEQRFGPDHMLNLRARALIGLTHVRRGRHDQALAVLNDVWRRVDAENPDQGLVIKVNEILLTLLQRRLGQSGADRDAILADMTELATQQVERATRHFGARHTQALQAHLSLIEVALRRSDYAFTIDASRALLHDHAHRLGECHYLMVQARRHLKMALHSMGQTREPAELAAKQIECMRQTEGEQSLATLSVICSGLPYLDRAEQWALGEEYAGLAGTIMQQFGAGHGNVALVPELYLARFASRQGRHDEAGLMFQSLLMRVNQTPGSIVAARLHAFYGAHLAQTGQFERGEDHLEKAVEIAAGHMLDETDTHNDDVVRAFIELYSEWGKPEEALKYQDMVTTPPDPQTQAPGMSIVPPPGVGRQRESALTVRSS